MPLYGMCRDFGKWPADALQVSKSAQWSLWLTVNYTVWAKGKRAEEEEWRRLHPDAFPAPRSAEEVDAEAERQSAAFEELLKKVGRA